MQVDFESNEILLKIRDNFYKNHLGNTPILKVSLDNGSTVYAKIEYFNRYGSIKDRAAFFMVYDKILSSPTAEMIVVEGTSGNTGIAIGHICRMLNIPSIIFVPPGVSEETYNELVATGANVVRAESTGDPKSTESAIRMAMDISVKEPLKYKNLHQHGNPMNQYSHIMTTGPEIMKDIRSNPDIIFISMGTGGSLTGIGKYFKEKDNSTKVIMGEADENSFIQGIRNFRKAKDKELIIKNMNLVDSIVKVSEVEAFKGVRMLSEYRVFSGHSGGGNFYHAMKIARTYEGVNVLTVIPDSGIKYIKLYENKKVFSKNEILEVSSYVKG
ncbi:cysteine synthase family protein [Caldiplasma sukawensis]